MSSALSLFIFIVSDLVVPGRVFHSGHILQSPNDQRSKHFEVDLEKKMWRVINYKTTLHSCSFHVSPRDLFICHNFG